LISNFRLVLNVVLFHLGDSPASEFYLPTFRNTLSHLQRQQEFFLLTPPLKMEQSVPQRRHITHLLQHCHNSKRVIFQEKLLKVLKCYNFLLVQRRHNCSPAASFASCVMNTITC